VTSADYTLLIVDDSDDNRAALTRRLAREGYTRVMTANNGRQALDLLAARPVDLVLLDIMMPELNGYEVLERLKADERLRHVPVIMISAVDQIESVIRCIELGAEDYLPKPFNPTLLRARVGASLEKKRLRDEIVAHLARIEGELALAREIQLSMVPTAFPAPTTTHPVEIHATLQPARQVGGDLYDFFWSDTRTLCFVIADVSDKGAPAALFMARTKTLIRLVATLLRGAGGDAAPHQIIARVNEELCQDNVHAMFVTVFFGMLDPASGELRFCNAGHNVPYVLGPTGSVVPVSGTRAKPLGIRPTLLYASDTAKLAPGDCLFLFTDGITESMDGSGAFFSEERLEATLRSLAGQAPRAIIEDVLASVRAFAGMAPQSDDIAALALRLVP
jgi:sigma-B regulation protein RsbU (phosphoserine phosphatase)